MHDFIRSRLFRCMICLLLICCFLVNASPIRAKADAVSGAAVAGAALVGIPVSWVIAAALIVLGVCVGTNEDFQNTVARGAEALSGYVYDGCIDVLQTVDALGQKTYYLAGDILEGLRSWLFDSEVVTVNKFVVNPNVEVDAGALAQAYSAPYSFFSYTLTVSGAYAGSMSYVLVYSYESPIEVTYADSSGNGYFIRCQDKSATIYSFNKWAGAWQSATGTAYGQNSSQRLVDSCFIGTADPLSFSTTLDLKLGVLSSSPIDGTSAREWAPEYANRGLYVVPGSGTGGNEGQDGKWFWPLAFAVTLADLWAMSQSESWTSPTPEEFPEYEEKQEYEVAPAPEFEGYPSIEISPSTNPDVDPGGGSDATEPEDPDGTSPTKPDTEGGADTGDAPDFPDVGGGEFPDPGGNPGQNPGTGTDPDPGTDTDPDVDPDPGADPDPNPDPDPGTDSESGSGSWTPSGPMGNFTLDLKNYFPFCIPFDLYAFFTCLNADPVAPVIDWIIPMPGGGSYSMEIDLSIFNSVAQTLRRLQLLLFCVGLAIKTRDLIKG